MKRFGSLRFKIMMITIVVITPMIGLLYYNNTYSMKVVHEQVARSYNSMLPMYIAQMDMNLDNIRNFLLNKVIKDEKDYLDLYQNKNDPIAFRITCQSIMDNLARDTASFSKVDSFFIFYSEFNELMMKSNYGATYDNKYKYLSKYFDTYDSQKDTSANQWQTVYIGNTSYLQKIVFDTEGVYYGALINIKDLFEPKTLTGIEDYSDFIVFTDDGSIVYSASLPGDGLESELGSMLDKFDENYQIVTNKDDMEKYLVVGEKSYRSNLMITIAVLDKDILRQLPFFQTMALIIPVLSAFLIILYFVLMRQTFLKSIDELVKGMNIISTGDFNIRLQEKGTEEFRFLVKTFNYMVAQIKDLKINVYEEKIKTQKAELKHLQVQINPHFYSNCLNTFYNLAALKEYKIIQKLSMHLSDYFGYIIRSQKTTITLEEEIDNIETYLQIQKIRFQEHLQYSICIEGSYEQCVIPQLTLQPLVENSIMHGFTDSAEALDINVSVLPDEADPESYYQIVIRDNGCGFSQEVLEELKAGNHLDLKNDSHLGMWNVANRLKICYQGKATINYDNNPRQGARITLRLPIQKQLEGE